MQFFRGRINIAQAHTGCVATIGNFDGLHLGHQQIISNLRQIANLKKLPLTVVLFEPHPKQFFLSNQSHKRITRLKQKLKLLAKLGVDQVLCLHFNHKLAQLSAEDFVSEILIKQLKIKYLLVGDDFKFGHKRLGDYDLLRKLSKQHKFELDCINPILIDGKRVSSTDIRTNLSLGNCEHAAKLLGRPFSLIGKIRSGSALGRKWGSPTANIILISEQEILPLAIYVVRARYEGTAYPAVASFGVRPTVTNDTKPVLEVYILSGEHELYGKELTVEFLHLIRKEEKFNSVQALRDAINHDIQISKQYFLDNMIEFGAL